MRKDNGHKKRVKDAFIKGVYVYYEIKGLNLNGFIESLRRQGVALYDVKKKGNDKLILAVRHIDGEKLFAINGNVWYNTYKIRKIKVGGGNYPLYFFMQNIGIAVGILIFAAVSFIADDFIFSFSFTGSGSECYKEITAYLNDNGITRFSRFSDIDLKSLEDSVLSSSGRLSFVSCRKSGNRLVIDSALSQNKTNRLSGKEEGLYSDVCGVIESVKVYRGTAVKSVGDSVSEGETIVAGYAFVKDVQVTVNVIATATVKYSQEYEIELSIEDDGAAVTFAGEIAGKTPTEYLIQKTYKDGKFLYTVKLYFLRVITVG